MATYKLHDVTQGNAPDSLSVNCIKDGEEYNFEVDAHDKTVEEVLTIIDDKMACTCLDYMDFKEHRGDRNI